MAARAPHGRYPAKQSRKLPCPEPPLPTPFRLLPALVICILMLFASATAARATDIVAYVWGGLLDQGTGVARFYNSVAFLLDRGFTSVRFAATPNAAASYGIGQSGCRGGRVDLGCILAAELDSRVFDDPRLRSLYITLQGTVDSDRAETDASALERDGRSVTDEYAGAFDVLARRFAGRPMPITILNWEGDNKVYCGSLYDFTRSVAARAACLRQGDPRDRVAGFVAWTRMRLQAVQEARRRHPGLDLRVGPEVNGLHALETCKPAGDCAGYPSLLSALPRLGRLPLCSYSAYDSLERGTLAADLRLLLRTCQQVILGEVGFRSNGGDGARLAAEYEAFGAEVQPFLDRIPAIVYWNGFEPAPPAHPGHGLFTSDGSPMQIRYIPPDLGPASGHASR